ncbi:MAG: hypothetical protein ACRENO_01080 [Thermodesulfobacteriota bacterium]
MKHFASSDFWNNYNKLPKPIRELADKNFEILKENQNYPSLHFKNTGKYKSIRIGIHYRALAIEIPERLLWFWIGNHSEYDKIIKK